LMTMSMRPWSKMPNSWQGNRNIFRIIALDFGEKRIFLSPSPSCVALSPFEGRQLLGKVLEGPSEVKKELYGGSFLISVGG
jgi:hypothetical protein